MREYGVQAHHPGRLIERGGLNQCYLVLAECLSDEIEAVRQRCIAKASFSTLAPAMVAVMVFSGLTNSICALARADAMAAIVGLDLCMSGLRLQEVKSHRAGLRAFSADSVPGGFLG